MSFTIVIVGRPNVGKSTLFNRLAGRRLALVHDRPGVTRDRREGEGRIGPLSFHLVDTAGLEEADPASLTGRMLAQTDAALREADLILFLIDARAGVTPIDEQFAARLRRLGKPVILVANKCEGRAADAGLIEAHALGFGGPVALSAEHGEGLADLYDRVSPAIEVAGAEAVAPGELESLEEGEGEEAAAARDFSRSPLRIALLGRPNVGKSTLANRLIGEERVLTGPEPGITRDAIAIDCVLDGRPARIFDTAGLRRRARIEDALERLSAGESHRAARFAEVVLLILDAEAPLERQDLTIARMVIDEGRAIVLVVNKWDLVRDRAARMGEIRDRIETSLSQVREVPIVTLSALTGAGLDHLAPAIMTTFEAWNRRVPTAALNRWLAEMTARHPPPVVRGRRIRLRYMTQTGTRPPSFAIFASQPRAVPDSYTRYLANGLDESFGFSGTPLRLHYRRGRNPYAPDEASARSRHSR